jgi:quercetin dioxygenase-like cupin family protein
LVEYTKDLEPHWCPKGHMGYVLEGRMEIAVGDQAEIFNPGDGVLLPAGEEFKHMARVLTDVVRIIFVEDA